MFDLLPVGIFCQLPENIRAGFLLPQALRVLALCSLFFLLAMVKDRYEPIGFGPKGFASVLTQDDLKMLREFYFIPFDFRIALSSLKGRIDRPPEGCLGVYEEALKADLYFSLHNFVV